MSRLGPHGLPVRSTDVSVTLTGAESLAQAGSVTNPPQLGPHGLVHRRRGIFTRDLNFTPVGAQSSAAAGVVTATATEQQQATHFGPHGLTSKFRQFSPKQAPNQNVDVDITGAQILGQAAVPDSAHATIYPDNGEISGESGSVASQDAFVTGSQTAGEAGSVTTRSDVSTTLTGAQSDAQAGEVNAGSGVFASISGAESLGEAQAPTLETDVNVSIAGARTDVQGSELGVDTNNPVSVTVAGAGSSAQAGSVIGGPNVTVTLLGAAIQAGPGAIEFEFIPPAAIVNDNAVTNVPNNYEQDPKSGFRVWPGDLITDGQTGDYTRRKSYDPRHPQELIRSVEENQPGPQQPEQDDIFVGTVSPDDL